MKASGTRGPSFGLVGTSADTDADTSPRRTRLTPRGDLVVATAVAVGIFLLIWAAEAVAYLVTGVA